MGSDTTEDIANLEAGEYTVTVIDSEFCAVAFSFAVGSPESLSASIDAEDISCFGANDGALTVQDLEGREWWLQVSLEQWFGGLFAY